MATFGLPLEPLSPPRQSHTTGNAALSADTLIVNVQTLPPEASSPQEHSQPPISTLKRSLWGLYLSHTFSTWNSRSFELGAVLFLASVFPTTLLPLSIYALVRSASAIVLGPTIGRAIDRRARLAVVRFSIGESVCLNKHHPSKTGQSVLTAPIGSGWSSRGDRIMCRLLGPWSPHFAEFCEMVYLRGSDIARMRRKAVLGAEHGGC